MTDESILTPRVITHGCRLNGYESEAMRQLGRDAGLSDTIIVNSCAVTNEAVRQTRRSIRRARRAHPDAKIVVTGCAAQIDPERFITMEDVDAVIGNDDKLHAETWRALAGHEARITHVKVNDIMAVRETAPHLIDGYGDRARAYLQIQNGCDHRCTFCIIPYGRGNSRSVPVDTVIAHAERLVEAGHPELVLTGVDITSYGHDLPGTPLLGDLVGALLDRVPQLFRLRLSSIDGAEIDAALFDRVTGDQRVAPYLHLSLQSGDDMILKRMKRRHTRRDALEFCERARARRPDIAFGADLIAGFPTETDAMFDNTARLIDEAGLSFVHVFPYSAREGTPAARMPQLDGAVIRNRAARLRAVSRVALHGFLDRLQDGTDIAVVEAGQRARLGNFAQVTLSGALANRYRPGELCRLTITGRNGDMLTAIRAPTP